MEFSAPQLWPRLQRQSLHVVPAGRLPHCEITFRVGRELCIVSRTSRLEIFYYFFIFVSGKAGRRKRNKKRLALNEISRKSKKAWKWPPQEKAIFYRFCLERSFFLLLACPSQQSLDVWPAWRWSEYEITFRVWLLNFASFPAGVVLGKSVFFGYMNNFRNFWKV